MADLESFRNRLHYYIGSVTIPRGSRVGRATQGNLALEIIMDPGDLSKRLHGKIAFSSDEVKRIIETLAKWKAITTQGQAVELLDLAGCEHFSQAQWSAKPLSELARSPDGSTPIATNTAFAKHPPLTGEPKDTWPTTPRLIREYGIVHYRFVIGALLALAVVVASSLAGWTVLHSFRNQHIQSKPSTTLTEVDWTNFTYPGLCNPNQGDHVTVKNRTAIDSGSQGTFFVHVYEKTLGDLTGDGQSEAIVPYSCSNTDPNNPMKGTVYIHIIIFSGQATKPVVLGQFPPLSGQANRDYASIDFLSINQGVLYLIGEGFSKAKSTTFDQQFSLTYHWTGTQFEIEHSKIDSIASLPLRFGNGQQLAYACPGMTEIEVHGTNQDKKIVPFGPNQVANGGLTWGWWWVGPVQIMWRDQAGKRHEDDHVSVPQQYGTYVYHATCT